MRFLEVYMRNFQYLTVNAMIRLQMYSKTTFQLLGERNSI